MSALKNVPEIQEIIGTTGDEDIVARISADPRENLLESVVSKVQGMPGALSTETLPAFRTINLFHGRTQSGSSPFRSRVRSSAGSITFGRSVSARLSPF